MGQLIAAAQTWSSLANDRFSLRSLDRRFVSFLRLLLTCAILAFASWVSQANASLPADDAGCMSLTSEGNSWAPYPVCSSRQFALERVVAFFENQRDYTLGEVQLGHLNPGQNFTSYSIALVDNSARGSYAYALTMIKANGESSSWIINRSWWVDQDCPAGRTWDDTAHQCISAYPYNLFKNEALVCKSNAHCGNPINVATGNKYQSETDFELSPLLGFTRHYNSHLDSGGSAVGPHWTHTYTRRVMPDTATQVTVLRPDGKQYSFSEVSGQWQPDADVMATLVKHTDGSGALLGWTYKAVGGDETEEYDALGRLSEIDRIDGTRALLTYNNGTLAGNDNDYLLTRVEATDGRSLVLSYDTSRRLQQITDTAGSVYTYGYDSLSRLVQVTFPGGNSKQYHYNESANTEGGSFANALTGITDESSQRFATFKYLWDTRAISTEHAGGVEKFSVQYNTNGSATITDPAGATQVRTFGTYLGVKKATAISESCTGCTTRSSSYSFDTAGRIDTSTDAGGAISDFDYNATGLLTQKIEASNDTATKRTVQTDWDATLSRPTERRLYNASSTLVSKTNWTYNSRGQVLTVTQTDPVSSVARTTTNLYCEAADVTANTCPRVGLLLSVDGARTDVVDKTAFTYYASDDATCASAPNTCPHRKGDLWKVTNAVGHVTETMAYDGAGRPIKVKDPNGVISEMTYHPRGWLTSRTIKGAATAEDRMTLIDYWPTGLMKRVTQTDGSYIQYSYDAAHRLTDIADSLGNTIHYTLDNAGHRTGEQTRDPSSALKRSLSRIYDQLGQLQSQSDAYSHATSYTYDANGNTDLTTDALAQSTDNAYDPLNRLTQSIQDIGGVTATTQFTYDAQDNLTRVTDPKGLSTDYTYNGFGDLVQLSSPDTGVTAYTYDSADNRATSLDARSKTQTYSYDALNRLISISPMTRNFTYDTNPAACPTNERFGKGHLTYLSDSSGKTTYCYNRFGDLVRKVQVNNGQTFNVLYVYDAAGRLSTQTYPDGAVLDFVRDAEGRITGMGLTPGGGVRRIVMTGATYAPFGPSTGWTYGNGRTFLRTLNQNYQPQAIQDAGSGGLSLGYSFNAVGNLTLLQDASQTVNLAQYGYDSLNRLAQVKDGPTGTPIETYSYDATGNRTSVLHAGVTDTYTYPSTSHKVSNVAGVARSYDAMGNTTQIGTVATSKRTFVYNDAGRLASSYYGGALNAQFLYNAKGEQIRRYLGTASTYFVYDEAGHVLGEYDTNGTPVQQYMWFGDLPVGVLNGAGAGQALHYVEPDHLGTPRVVIDGVRNVPIWKWDITGEAFGATPPSQDPDGDSIPFVFNLRFPGQRYDSNTNFNYNYFRDYDPSTGRYVESDPIGLGGGVSTYSYVGQSPLQGIDPFGLQAVPISPVTPGLPPLLPNQNPASSNALDPADPYSSLMPKASTSNQCPNDDCPPLLEKINNVVWGMKGMNSRWIAMAKDQYNLYELARYTNPGGALLGLGTWVGHIAKYEGLRVYLGALIRQAQNRGCAIPQSAWDAYLRPVPLFPFL